jgi:hypothetical protein
MTLDLSNDVKENECSRMAAFISKKIQTFYIRDNSRKEIIMRRKRPYGTFTSFWIISMIPFL